MLVDWDLVLKLAGPMIGALVGAGAKHLFDSRPRVVAFLGHASGIRLHREEGDLQVGTHSVVLRNAGNKTAKNIRIGHTVLPDFQVLPDIQYTVETLPGGIKEIRFDHLIPKKQITVTYLYFAPLTWDQVNTHLETEDGPVRILRVLPTIQLSKPVLASFWVLIGVGFVSIVYLLLVFVGWLPST